MTFDQALSFAGGTQTALAEMLGLTQSAVSQWDRVVPARYQYQLEVISGGKLLADPELRRVA